MNEEAQATIDIPVGDAPPLSISIAKEDLDMPVEFLARLRDWNLQMACLVHERQLIEDERQGATRKVNRRKEILVSQWQRQIAAYGLKAATLQELITLKGEL